MSEMISGELTAYDRRIDRGSSLLCMYDFDIRDVRDAATAHRLLEQLNSRLTLGREREPSAAHYVNVIARRPRAPDFLPDIDDEVRGVLFPDGIVGADSVSVEAR